MHKAAVGRSFRTQLQPLACRLREDSFFAPCRELAPSHPPCQPRTEIFTIPIRNRDGSVPSVAGGHAVPGAPFHGNAHPANGNPQLRGGSGFEQEETEKTERKKSFSLLPLFSPVQISALVRRAFRLRRAYGGPRWTAGNPQSSHGSAAASPYRHGESAIRNPQSAT